MVKEKAIEQISATFEKHENSINAEKMKLLNCQQEGMNNQMIIKEILDDYTSRTE